MRPSAIIAAARHFPRICSIPPSAVRGLSRSYSCLGSNHNISFAHSAMARPAASRALHLRQFSTHQQSRVPFGAFLHVGIGAILGVALAHFGWPESVHQASSAEITPPYQTSKMVKIVIFVPLVPPELGSDAYKYVEEVRRAMIQAGGGTIGDYTGCCFLSEGTSHYKQPGLEGKEKSHKEVRIEMVCEESMVEAVVQAARAVHPWKTMGVDLFHMLEKTPS